MNEEEGPDEAKPLKTVGVEALDRDDKVCWDDANLENPPPPLPPPPPKGVVVEGKVPGAGWNVDGDGDCERPNNGVDEAI